MHALPPNAIFSTPSLISSKTEFFGASGRMIFSNSKILVSLNFSLRSIDVVSIINACLSQVSDGNVGRNTTKTFTL